MDENFSFGYWLRRRRKALDLTQDELARQVGCAVSTIKKLEGDERRPSREMAGRLADLLAIPPEERDAFLHAARAELGTHHLALAAEPLARPAATSAPPLAGPGDTLTFLFTDIEGSTRLWERYPEWMRFALLRHDALLRQAIEAHGGHVFKTVGDAFCAAFATAPDALVAALEAQRALVAEPWAELARGAQALPNAAPPALRVRMALHAGAVEQRDGDYFGHPLSRVARILAAGHGGQILLSAATWELVRDQLPPDVALRDLGAHWLKSLRRPEQLFQVVASDLPVVFPALAALERPLSNLPEPPNALIGREREVAAVVALARQPDVRLITLTGPGGTGKTRLALEAAARVFADDAPEGTSMFSHGVWFIDLAPISDTALVAATMMQVFAVRDQEGRSPLDTLKDYLHERRLLLLLDNFEQVVDAAPVVAELLAVARGLKVLVTSRVPLHLSGEHEYAVPPLGLPEPAQAADLAQLAQYDAVRLFIARARAVRADFVVTSTNAPALAEICHRLDGLPLAIELAAARVKLFPLQALLARMGDRLRFLTGGARDLPARQQTIRNTIDWSYQLLDAAEQRLFTQLSVFVGGFTLEAAEVVCGGEGGPPDVVEGVAGLLDKSLLRQSESAGDEPRFVMLETVREYALERLAQSGEAEALRRRHAAHMRSLVAAAERGIWSPEEQRWRDRIWAEAANLRAAVEWSLEGEDPNLGAAILVDLWYVWVTAEHHPELLAWTEQALGLGGTIADVPRAALLRNRGEYLEMRGEINQARQLYEESFVFARASGDKRTLGRGLIDLARAHRLSDLAHALPDYAHAESLVDEGMALCRESGDSVGYIYALRMKTHIIATLQGQYERYGPLTVELLELCQQLGQPSGIAEAYNRLGELARWQGDYARAKSLYEQSLGLYRSIFSTRSLTSGAGGHLALSNLGFTDLRLGDVSGAVACFRETLAMVREGGRYPLDLALEATGWAGVLLLMRSSPGDTRRAARLLGAARRLWEQTGVALEHADVKDLDWIVGLARDELGEEAFAVASAEGRALSWEQVIDEILGEERDTGA